MKLNELGSPDQTPDMRSHWHSNVVKKISAAEDDLKGLIQYLHDANLAEEGQLEPYEQALKNLDAALSTLTLRI
jgi:hypothetical protein